MATPPFSLQTTIPGDSDIVSQYPATERINRDVIQSWLLANHDSNGNHLQAIFPWQSSVVSTPGASLIAVYADAVGRLKIVYPDGSIGFVGIPPGSVIYTAMKAAISTPPVGWLFPDGSAVSRATYADLFAQIGTDFGSGDGTLTFNLPNAIGRVFAHADPSGTRLTSAGFGTAAIIGAAGGGAVVSILQTNIPNYTISVSGNISVNSVRQFGEDGSDVSHITPASGGSSSVAVSTPALVTSSGVNSMSGPSGGSGTPLAIVQPTLVMRALIKV